MPLLVLQAWRSIRTSSWCRLGGCEGLRLSLVPYIFSVSARGFLPQSGSQTVRRLVSNYGNVIPSSVKGVTNLVIKQPVGVVGIVTPYNFPLTMVTRKVGAAIAAGRTMVLKAPAETPYTVSAVCKCWDLSHDAANPIT